jgi:hypothetical protein
MPYWSMVSNFLSVLIGSLELWMYNVEMYALRGTKRLLFLDLWVSEPLRSCILRTIFCMS